MPANHLKGGANYGVRSELLLGSSLLLLRPSGVTGAGGTSLLPSATSTAINSRAVAIAGLSSEIRGVRPVNFGGNSNSSTPELGVVQVHRGKFSLRVAQRLERQVCSRSLPIDLEVDGASPSPQELVGGLRSGLKNRVNASPARQFPSVAIIDGHAPNGTCLRLVSHEFPALHQAADAVTGGNLLSTPEIRA